MHYLLLFIPNILKTLHQHHSPSVSLLTLHHHHSPSVSPPSLTLRLSPHTPSHHSPSVSLLTLHPIITLRLSPHTPPPSLTLRLSPHTPPHHSPSISPHTPPPSLTLHLSSSSLQYCIVDREDIFSPPHSTQGALGIKHTAAVDGSNKSYLHA